MRWPCMSRAGGYPGGGLDSLTPWAALHILCCFGFSFHIFWHTSRAINLFWNAGLKEGWFHCFSLEQVTASYNLWAKSCSQPVLAGPAS